MFRLDGKAALVTGAARGLGQATVKVLAAQGAHVFAADINFEEVSAVARAIGASVTPYRVDVSKVEQLKAMVDAVVRDRGRINVLVNNAGICPRLPFADSTETDWQKLFDVNAKGQYFLAQAACLAMKKTGGGRIINISSTGGRVGGFANSSIYSGTKGAIVMFTKSIAREVAADGILVNCVAPGLMDTDLMRNLPTDKKAALTDQIPLKRLADPAEVANAIAFLASDECSYATGATFDINGGWIML